MRFRVVPKTGRRVEMRCDCSREMFVIVIRVSRLQPLTLRYGYVLRTNMRDVNSERTRRITIYANELCYCAPRVANTEMRTRSSTRSHQITVSTCLTLVSEFHYSELGNVERKFSIIGIKSLNTNCVETKWTKANKIMILNGAK